MALVLGSQQIQMFMLEFPTLPAPATLALKASRIATVDALRGFALFGILLVHAAQWFTAGPLPGSFYQAHTNGPVNSVVQTIIGVFFDGKYYTFFSFLFGLSFALMLTRNTDSPGRFYARFAWRLVILGAIGLLHHIQWRGDILSIYAILGFLMLPFGRLPNKVVLGAALLLTLNMPGRVVSLYDTLVSQPVPQQANAPAGQNFEKEAKAYYDLLTNGSFTTVAEANFYAFDDKMKFQVDSGRLYITLGFFLLGLYAGRRRLFQQIAANKRLFRQITRVCGFGVLGIIILFVAAISIYGNNSQPPKAIDLLFGFLFDVGNTAMTVFYIAGLTLLFQRPFWQGVVHPLASVGKMALTSYILQTIIGTFLFFGYGLGLLNQLNLWQAALLTFPIFMVQVVFSQWWLARFQYGPLEWLWRSLTYGQAQPMQRFDEA